MRLVPAMRGIVTAALIEPGALLAALQAGRPGMAALDVFEQEPIQDPGYPLPALPNVVCAPHIGFVTRGEFDLQLSDVFEQIAAFEPGTPIDVANPDALATNRNSTVEKLPEPE